MEKILENTEFYLIKRTHNGQRFIARSYKTVDLLEVCWGNKNGMNLMVEGKELPYLTLPKISLAN